MASSVILRNLSCVKLTPWMHVVKAQPLRTLLSRFVSTSNKGGPKKSGGHDIPPQNPVYGGDADVFVSPNQGLRPKGSKTVEEFADPSSQKNWISYGFDYVDKSEDRFRTHAAMFTVITMIFGGVAFIFYYYPDIKMDAWASREAYLQMYRRKKLGLPLIDKNYVEPSRVPLPTEEEIGDQEIII